MGAESERQYALRVATANRLSFVEMQQTLSATGGNLQLDAVYRSLDNDYRIISYLQQHAADLGGAGFEGKLLALDYKIMQMTYRVSKSLAPERARKSLSEMARILSFLAEQMGQHSIQSSAA